MRFAAPRPLSVVAIHVRTLLARLPFLFLRMSVGRVDSGPPHTLARASEVRVRGRGCEYVGGDSPEEAVSGREGYRVSSLGSTTRDAMQDFDRNWAYAGGSAKFSCFGDWYWHSSPHTVACPFQLEPTERVSKLSLINWYSANCNLCVWSMSCELRQLEPTN